MSEFENDHLEQVACTVGADHEQPGWVVLLVEVDNDDRVIDDMADRSVIDAVATS